MPEIFRAFIVVMALSAFAFYLGQRVAAQAISPSEFRAWRNAWFVATAAGFLLANFFLYALVAVALMFYLRAQGAFGPALFPLLLFVVPSVNINIGGFGIVNELITLNNPILLAVVVLIPTLLSLNKARKVRSSAGRVADVLIVSYVLLISALHLRDASLTAAMRAGVVNALIILVPYFALSRAVMTVHGVRKVLTAFVLAALPLCLVGIFETFKDWHLYSQIADAWGVRVTYLERAGFLRAKASAGGPIALAFVVMMMMGCLLALRTTLSQTKVFVLCFVLFGAALIATFSRGPWVGAVGLIVMYLATGPRPAYNLAKLAALGFLLIPLLLLTPTGARMLDFLPFVGDIDSGSITYRRELFYSSIAVVARNPLFGLEDFESEPEMKEMMTGQNIIDIVNTYLMIALRTGLAGLGLFIAFFVSILLALRRSLRSAKGGELYEILRALTATLVGILIALATTSSVSYVATVYWSITGLCVAAVRIAQAEKYRGSDMFPAKTEAIHAKRLHVGRQY